MDHRRNELVALDLLVTCFSAAFTFVAMVAGLWGAGLRCAGMCGCRFHVCARVLRGDLCVPRAWWLKVSLEWVAAVLLAIIERYGHGTMPVEPPPRPCLSLFLPASLPPPAALQASLG